MQGTACGSASRDTRANCRAKRESRSSVSCVQPQPYVDAFLVLFVCTVLGLVPTIGGMLGNSALYYLCCDIFPIVMDPTYLDDKPDFFTEGGRARPVALFCLEFYTQLAAQFGLRLVINSSRGLKLLEAMFGTALCKLPGAAGEIGVGYHFKLEVRFGGRTFVVRGFGTKHPCWWWRLLRILALYRAQVATCVHWPLRIWRKGFRALLRAGTAAPDSAAA
jgi:hypothetical protein